MSYRVVFGYIWDLLLTLNLVSRITIALGLYRPRRRTLVLPKMVRSAVMITLLLTYTSVNAIICKPCPAVLTAQKFDGRHGAPSVLMLQQSKAYACCYRSRGQPGCFAVHYATGFPVPVAPPFTLSRKDDCIMKCRSVTSLNSPVELCRSSEDD